MKRSGWIHGLRRDACLLAVATICAGALPQEALADQVQAYVVFEIGAAAEDSAGEKLRSTSLGNCKQLIVGRQARDIFVHIACDDSSYLNEAFLRLSQLDGIARATIVSLKRD